MQARMVCAPDLAVTSARLPVADNTLWMAARLAEAARKETFFPAVERQQKRDTGDQEGRGKRTPGRDEEGDGTPGKLNADEGRLAGNTLVG